MDTQVTSPDLYELGVYEEILRIAQEEICLHPPRLLTHKGAGPCHPNKSRVSLEQRNEKSHREFPPGETLPESDGVPMDSDIVVDQTRAYLIYPLREYLEDRGVDAFVSGNSFLYYDPDRPPVGPDLYVVLGGKWNGQKKWVSWEEDGKLATTVMEFLSPSTEENDRGKKFLIYRDVFRAPEYFLIDQDTLFIEGYQYNKGHYLTMSPDADGWFDVPSLGLQLGPHDGWIRWRTAQGALLPTMSEKALFQSARAEQEKARAEQEKARAESERERREALEAKLRELGIDPDSIS